METPRCPSIDDWIKKMWHMYNGILLSRKKDGILPFVTAWVDLENIMLNKICQSGKTKNHIISLIYRI